MRKRNIKQLFDTIFWYSIYMLPFLLFIIMTFNSNYGTAVTFETVFNSLGFQFTNDNIIYNTLYSIFGTGGVFPLFSGNTIFLILTYFITANFLHIAVDFLLIFIRLVHNFFDNIVDKERGLF